MSEHYYDDREWRKDRYHELCKKHNEIPRELDSKHDHWIYKKDRGDTSETYIEYETRVLTEFRKSELKLKKYKLKILLSEINNIERELESLK